MLKLRNMEGPTAPIETIKMFLNTDNGSSCEHKRCVTIVFSFAISLDTMSVKINDDKSTCTLNAGCTVINSIHDRHRALFKAFHATTVLAPRHHR